MLNSKVKIKIEIMQIFLFSLKNCPKSLGTSRDAENILKFFFILLSFWVTVHEFHQNWIKNKKKFINRTFFVNKLLTLFFNFLKNLSLNFAKKEDYWQKLENFFFQGRSLLEGKIQNKFLKFLLFQKVHPSPEIQQFLRNSEQCCC